MLIVLYETNDLSDDTDTDKLVLMMTLCDASDDDIRRRTKFNIIRTETNVLICSFLDNKFILLVPVLPMISTLSNIFDFRTSDLNTLFTIF